MNRRLTTEEFIAKANIIHNHKYGYSKTIYKTARDKLIITCPLHGDYQQKAISHSTGKGCKICGDIERHKSKTLTLEEFVNRANEKHNNKYGYDKVIYTTVHHRIKVTCPLHGDFEQITKDHLNGSGCPKCGNLDSGWSRSAFKERCDNKNNGLGILYIIKCFNKEEEFYKIGIASNSIKERYKCNMPYDYEIIHEVHREPNKVYDMENKLLRNLANHSYQPLIPFSGQTECIDSLDPFYKLLKQYITQ